MPEIKKNLESNLEPLPVKEALPVKEEQKESLPNIEKVSELETVVKKEEDSSVQANTQTTDSQQQLIDNPMSRRLREAVDDILEEGLEDIYLNMSKEGQKEFKIKGEETTKTIVNLLSEAKVKVKKIVQVIIEWLKMISGINKFFIKQTAKIKTDKILDAKEKELSAK